MIIKDRNSENVYYIIGSDILEFLSPGHDYVLAKADRESYAGYFFDWDDYTEEMLKCHKIMSMKIMKDIISML